MRIYLFDPDTGVYQGDDFTDETFHLGDAPELPSGATAVAPPPPESGKVPCFESEAGRWTMRLLPPRKGPPPPEERVYIPVTNDD